jgi:hypothetical protein
MARFAGITNGSFVNQYDCEVRVTAAVTTLGVGADNRVDLYSTVFTVQAGQLQLNLDPVLGKTKEINDIINKRGWLAGSTSGAVQLNPKTASITLKTDYVFLTADKKGTEMSSSIIEGMLKGEGFMSGSTYKKVLGTAGTYKRGFNTVQNRFFGKLFDMDGRLIISDASTVQGDSITIPNIRKTAYDKTCNYLIFEVISKFDEETIDGFRFVYTMNSDVQWSDATDANEISFTQTQLCDARMIRNFFVEGFEAAEYGTDVPARRTIFAKRPVSIFKGKASVTAGAVDGYTAGTGALTAGTSFELPDKVIKGDLATGQYVTEIYDPALHDIAVINFPATGTTSPGYGIALCSAAPVYAYTPLAVGTGLITAVGTNTITIDGDEEAQLPEGTIIRVTVGVGQYEEYTVVSADYGTATVVTLDSDVSTKVAVGNAVATRATTTPAVFTLIKNSYLLADTDMYNTPVASTSLTDGLMNLFDYNFEELSFYEIDA